MNNLVKLKTKQPKFNFRYLQIKISLNRFIPRRYPANQNDKLAK